MRLGADEKAAALQLVGLVIQAFSKKAKARKIAEYLAQYPELEAAYKTARAKIDLAEAQGAGVTLTVAETRAVDVVMDAAGKAAGKLKRAL